MRCTQKGCGKLCHVQKALWMMLPSSQLTGKEQM